MKLGDGSKVSKHKSADCAERNRLSNEHSISLAELYESLEAAKETLKSDVSHEGISEKLKKAKGKVKDTQQKLTAHVRDHGCW
jgi:DeoR/GlpR family transcriptional regulator of sugar metabolism